jgi:transcriptional regulator with XRE-family HTH domain
MVLPISGVTITIGIMDLTNLPGRAAAVRELLGVSARDASKIAGLSPTMWSRIETGERDDLRISTVAQIVGKAGVSLEWFALGRGPMLPDHPSLDPARKGDRPQLEQYLRKAVGLTGGSRAASTGTGVARTKPRSKKNAA